MDYVNVNISNSDIYPTCILYCITAPLESTLS